MYEMPKEKGMCYLFPLAASSAICAWCMPIYMCDCHTFLAANTCACEVIYYNIYIYM